MPAKTVAVELVEKAGINVKTLLNLLISNASAELTHYPAREPNWTRRRRPKADCRRRQN
jgi:hypothetical protein